MTLLINNSDVQQVLTMEATIGALSEAYADGARGEAVCRPRIDVRIPTSDPAKFFQYGTMEGGSTRGYFAIRMKSDVVRRSPQKPPAQASYALPAVDCAQEFRLVVVVEKDPDLTLQRTFPRASRFIRLQHI